MWPIEARNASIANNYFVACNNRVGTVSYNKIINISYNNCIARFHEGVGVSTPKEERTCKSETANT